MMTNKLFITLIIFLLHASINAQRFTKNSLFNEEFENVGEIPANWSQEIIVGNVSWIGANGGHQQHPQNAYSGAYNAFFFSGEDVNSVCRLITPLINLGGQQQATLSFWYAMDMWVTDIDTLRVKYRSSPSSPWILIKEYSQKQTEWKRETFELTNISAEFQIAFEAVGGYGYGICLDSVDIFEVVSMLEYYQDFENDGNIPDSWTQEQLSGITQWEFATGGFLGQPESAYSGAYNARFYTENYDHDTALLITPLFDFSIYDELALFFYATIPPWNNDIDQLDVLFKNDTSTTWHKLLSITEGQQDWQQFKIQLPALSPQYQIAFRAISNYGYGICIDNVSLWEGVLTSFAKVHSKNRCTIFPNPIQNHCVTITFSENILSSGKIDVYDITGKKIISKDIFRGKNQTQIKFPQHLLNGIYIIRIATKEFIYTKKLIKI